jgi:hypothetical protein
LGEIQRQSKSKKVTDGERQTLHVLSPICGIRLKKRKYNERELGESLVGRRREKEEGEWG